MHYLRDKGNIRKKLVINICVFVTLGDSSRKMRKRTPEIKFETTISSMEELWSNYL